MDNNQILEAAFLKIKGPIFGYFVFSFVVFNWQPLFYLFFESVHSQQKFYYFQENTNFNSLFLWPALVAAGFCVGSLYINAIFIYINRFPTDYINKIQAKSESNLSIERRKNELVANRLLVEQEKQLVDQAITDQNIEMIEDEEKKSEVKEAVKELRKQAKSRSESKATLTATFSTNDKEDEILEYLYQAGRSPGGHLDTGLIGIIRKFDLSGEEALNIMEGLDTKKFANTSISKGSDPNYSITNNGIKHLIKKDILK